MIFKRIKDLREDNDLTQQAMADMLNISRSSYSAYENGTNAWPIEVLIAIAKYYNVSIDYLVELTEHPTPYR